MTHHNSTSHRYPELVVFGWDAVSWDLIEPWLEEGSLPTLSGLMERGSSAEIRSTHIPVSPAAWSSIITGVNPGQHGVFDWYQRAPESYAMEYVHTGRNQAVPIWTYLNEAGKTVGVVNLPMIYPAVPVDGFMISGMAAPGSEASGFSFPPDLINSIEEELGPYMMDEGVVFKTGQEQPYFDAQLDWIEYQKKLVNYLIRKTGVDILLFVFMQSDHVQHKFWRYHDPSFPAYNAERDAPYSRAIRCVIEALDQTLGEILAPLPKETNIMVLSDHGAGPNHGVFYVNQWLMRNGWLTLKDDFSTRLKLWLARTDLVGKAYKLASRIGLSKLALLVSKPARDKVMNSFISLEDIDWARTRAYASGSIGQITLNLQGREPQGIVQAEDADEVLQQLSRELAEIRHPETGQPLVNQITCRDDVFHGPHLENGADLMFTIDNYRISPSRKLGLEKDSLLGVSEYEDSGSHRMNGILVLAGPAAAQTRERCQGSVYDVLPTILALSHVPVPDNLDGEPLYRMLSTETIRSVNIIQTDTSNALRFEKPDLDERELAVLEDRLQSLGYLE